MGRAVPRILVGGVLLSLDRSVLAVIGGLLCGGSTTVSGLLRISLGGSVHHAVRKTIRPWLEAIAATFVLVVGALGGGHCGLLLRSGTA
jgi:hypothetical protein